MSDPIDTDAARTLIEKMTSRPWRLGDERHGDWYIWGPDNAAYGYVAQVNACGTTTNPREEREANGIGIIGIVNNAEAWLGEIDRLRAELAAAERRNDDCICAFCGHSEPRRPGEVDLQMAEHIAVCENHPMRRAVEAYEQEKAKLAAAERQRDEWRVVAERLAFAAESMLSLMATNVESFLAFRKTPDAARSHHDQAQACSRDLREGIAEYRRLAATQSNGERG